MRITVDLSDRGDGRSFNVAIDMQRTPDDNYTDADIIKARDRGRPTLREIWLRATGQDATRVSGQNSDNYVDQYGVYLVQALTAAGWTSSRILEVIAEAVKAKVEALLNPTPGRTVSVTLSRPTTPDAVLTLPDPITPDMIIPTLLVAGGKIYKADFHEDDSTDLNDLIQHGLDRHRTLAITALTSYKHDVEGRLRTYRENLGIPMPDINRADTAKIKVFRVDGQLVMEFPFKYRPMFVNQKRMKLTPEREARIWRNVRCQFFFSVGARYTLTRLVTVRGGSITLFHHYHRECWGNYRFEDMEPSVSRLAQVVTALEALLAEVNCASLAEHRPIGMPDDHELRDWADEYEAEHPGSTRDLWTSPIIPEAATVVAAVSTEETEEVEDVGDDEPLTTVTIPGPVAPADPDVELAPPDETEDTPDVPAPRAATPPVPAEAPPPRAVPPWNTREVLAAVTATTTQAPILITTTDEEGHRAGQPL